MRIARIVGLIVVAMLAVAFALAMVTTVPAGELLGLGLSCAGVGLLAAWRPR